MRRLYTQIANSSQTATGPIAFVNTDNCQTSVLPSGEILPRLFALDFNPQDGFLYALPASFFSLSGNLLKIDPSSGSIVSSIELSSNVVAQQPGSMLFPRTGESDCVDIGRWNALRPRPSDRRRVEIAVRRGRLFPAGPGPHHSRALARLALPPRFLRSDDAAAAVRH